jgi:hypothetical protein
VRLQHIDLTTDGSTSHVNGMVDFSQWPVQQYNVNSIVDFPRMKEIFFQHENWRLGGSGSFTGIFKVAHDGRYDLSGDFASDDARLSDVLFANLHGSLHWNPSEFVVTHADMDVFGGDARLSSGLAPLGTRQGATATFAADYGGIDLAHLADLLSLRSLQLEGRASGSVALEWPNGHFAQGRHGDLHMNLTPPDGIEAASPVFGGAALPPLAEPAPFDPHRLLGPLAIGGDIDAQLDPQGWTFEDGSWAATSRTYVRFGGRLASSGTSAFPFHVTSHDWQESDRVLAGIMTALSGPTGAIQIHGRGTFDGQMTGTFSAPTIAGRFVSDATHVWDVGWGHVEGDAVIHGGYVDISNARIGEADRSIVPAGRFALGFRPGPDVEEINAQVRFTNWPMADIRHAFGLDDWPVDGVIADAQLTLTGRYKSMFGAGRMRIDRGTAWGEQFETATGDLDLEGTGVAIHRMLLNKGPGIVHGDARIGWDGTYAFNADGDGIPVESLQNFQFPSAPLSGRLKFTASGASEFDAPSYRFSGSIDDLFIGDQGVGQVRGDIRIENQTLWIERLLATSSLLYVDGHGSLALDDRYDANLHWDFIQSSLDPYLKFFGPEFSRYTRAIISGSLDVKGPLKVPDELAVSTSIDDATLTLFDYELKNDGPVRLSFAEDAFRVDQLRLRGRDTNLTLTGRANRGARTWDLAASGNASLAILQLFFPVTASGAATLDASLGGSFDAPLLQGSATIAGGRLRPFYSPHSLDAINGSICFDGTGITLDGLTGRIGNGDVQFGGSIALEQYRLADLAITARGRSMRLRYPASFNSTVDMDLRLTGTLAAPRLGGSIDVLKVSFVGQSDVEGFLGLPAVSANGAATPPAPIAAPSTSAADEPFPLALDIQVTMPRTTLIDNRTVRVEGRADLHVGGTFDHPGVTGSLDVLSGEMTILGNRYYVREGSIEFASPDRIEPVFDITLETRPRVAGQTYDVTIRISGPLDFSNPLTRLRVEPTSDPYLSETDIASLLFGGTPDYRNAEQRALRSPQESQQQMLQTMGAVLLTSPISTRIGNVVERMLPIDTVQITPLLSSDISFQQLNPSARVTLGTRISPRVYLTYSRTLNTTGAASEEIILLEYEQSDRISWVLSRNEDRSFALDFRIRYVF